MGWKIATLVTPLDRDLQAIADEIYGAPQRLEQTDLPASRAAYPKNTRDRYALAHDGFAWFFDWNGIERRFHNPLPIARTVWTFSLHSVTNGYGFSLQKKGAFVRSRMGSADSGIEVEVGEPFPTERALVTAEAKPGQEEQAWAAWRDADESFDGTEFGDLTHDTIAEEIVLGLMQEATTLRLDRDTPATTAFEVSRVMQLSPLKPKSLLDRLLGETWSQITRRS